MDFIKKIFAILSNFSAFSNLFKKAASTGKLEPTEVLSALSSLSPDTKKISDTAMNIAQRGGNISDVAEVIENVGKVNVLGSEIDTRTMITDLRKAGGICGMLANILDGMKKQTPQQIVEFGEQATKLDNWSEILNQSNVNP